MFRPAIVPNTKATKGTIYLVIQAIFLPVDYAGLRREPTWRCGACGVTHDRNLNAARNLQKFALGAVGPDVMRLDSKALVRLVTDETIRDEGRTGSLAAVHPAAD